jgi:iron complex outermembrane recepter protein
MATTSHPQILPPRAPFFSALVPGLLCLLLAVQMLRADIDLTRMGLEELMQVEVNLVSRKPQRLISTAAAAAVLTPEDLRRSGGRSIPEALRLVPGMQVARIDANKWAVTSRGFAGPFANKLLVLIDGRSVYSPLFSGVFWESQNTDLESVERIEVIRGPGGSLWGTNAVNGIVNVVTRNAAETQGWRLHLGGGTTERGSGSLRYGGRRREALYYRIFGSFSAYERSRATTPLEPRDAWRILRGGSRIDWQPSSRDGLTLLADLYASEVGQSLLIPVSLTPPYERVVHAEGKVRGGSLVGRWERELNPHEGMALQVYLDRSERNEEVLQGTIHNADIDFQHHGRIAPHLEVIWGLGYRLTWDDFTETFSISIEPSSRSAHLLSGFFHAGLPLIPEHLRLSMGAKLERNSYTGVELQPNLRAWWSPAPSHAFWVALSRAARIPSRSERGFRGITDALPPDALFPGSPVAMVTLLGNPHFDSEKLAGIECGFRTRVHDLALDLTAFHNRYDDLRTNELGLPILAEDPSPRHLVIPVQVDNKGSGWTQGWEGMADWQRWQRWRLHAAYSFLRMRLNVAAGSTDEITETYAREVPSHQFILRSSLDLTDRLELDANGRYVSRLSALEIPSYRTLDLRLGISLSKEFMLSLVGRNLLDSPHPEFLSTAAATLPTAVEASFYAALSWNPGKRL